MSAPIRPRDRKEAEECETRIQWDTDRRDGNRLICDGGDTGLVWPERRVRGIDVVGSDSFDPSRRSQTMRG